MSGGETGGAVAVGSLWKRKQPGRETVRVERCWQHGPDLLVRAHPTTGGRPLIASVDYLRDRYDLVTTPATPPEGASL